MKKKIALLLATVASVATIFTGCGEKDISGDYKAEFKLADFMDESDLSQMEDMGIDMSDITVDVTLNLTDDKNFTFAFDTASFREQFSSLVNDNIDAIIDKGLEMNGMTRDSITDELVQANGYEDSDAFFADMKDQVSSVMDEAYDEIDKEMEEGNVTGTYSVSKNSVTFVLSDEEEGVGLDNGTIGSDDSISIVTEYEDQEKTLVFNKQ